MSSIQDILVSVLMELVRVVIIVEYFQIFFDKASTCKKVVAALTSYVITTGCYLGFHNSLLNIISTIIGVFIIAYIHNGSIKKKILHTAMCFAVCCGGDMLAAFALMEAPRSDNYVLLSSFLSVIIFYVFVVVLRNLYRGRDREEFSGQWYFLLLIALMSISVSYALLKDELISRITALTVITVILAVNIMLYYFYTSMLDRSIYEQENIRLREQIAIYEAEIRTNVEHDKKIRALRHDMKHHLREIFSLARRAGNNDIMAYLDQMYEDIDETKNVVDSGNSVFDGILNYYAEKIKEEKKGNVSFSTRIIIPDDLEVNSFDINVILGNLLDNALENVSGVVEAQRLQIAVVIEYIEGLLRIEVRNTFAGKVKKEGDRFVSHKGTGHGYGISNVRRTADKYKGYVLLEVVDGNFEAVVLLYM